mmetsp:Transcript_46649/g.116876  ORF Transcript_46649/g.116876 Transcript_46649/m.116876 type:complete len:176 (-) Transcript_46649:733-1260(-)
MVTMEEVRNVDRRALLRGERDLCLLEGTAEGIDRCRVVRRILVVSFLKLCQQMLKKRLGQVLTPEVLITTCRHDLKDSTVEGQQADIESAATKVVDQYVGTRNLLQPICKSSGSWFTDDPKNFKTRRLSCRYRGVSLLLSKVGWHRQDSLDDGPLDVSLHLTLELSQHVCPHLGW